MPSSTDRIHVNDRRRADLFLGPVGSRRRRIHVSPWPAIVEIIQFTSFVIALWIHDVMENKQVEAW